MNDDVLTLDQRNIRGCDSNSLLRLYDAANSILNKSQVHQERLKAGKAIQRIVKELQKRNIST